MSDAYLSNLLGEREKILLVTHQHWFQLFRSILAEIILMILTIIAVILVYIFWVPTSLTMLGFLLLLIPILSILRDVMVWNNHKYVVTSRRVIQVFGVFNKNVTDSSLEKVNDVKMDQSVLGRIFNFGDIEILTASELGINRFTFIGDPVRFKTAMLNAKFELDQQEAHPYAAPTPDKIMDVPRLIEQLDDLRKRGALSEAEFQEKRARLLARI
jgi:uncharacterized membrane protein YdbT with pleckstrin-like domain